ncbi:MAG: ATP-binding protein [Fimbriiglobus sp.]
MQKTGFQLWKFAVVALGYWAAGYLGLSLPTQESSISLIWPATGLAVGLLLRWGLVYATAVFIGAYIVNVSLAPSQVALGIAVGNTLAPVLSVLALRRLGCCGEFANSKAVVRFIVINLLAMSVSALNGSLWVYFSGGMRADRLTDAMVNWWLGDALGVMLGAIPVITFELKHVISKDWSERRARSLGFGFCLVLVVFTWLMSYHGSLGNVIMYLLNVILVLGLVIRFGVWSASMGILGLMFVMVFTGLESPRQSLSVSIAIWSNLFALQVVVLFVAVLLQEQKRTLELLRMNQLQYQVLVEDTPAIIIRFRSSGELTFVNRAGAQLNGAEPKALLGRSIYEFAAIENHDQIRKTLIQCMETRLAFDFEATFVGDLGTTLVIRWSARVISPPGSDELLFQAVGLDVTAHRQAEMQQRAYDAQALHAQRLESLGVMAGGIAHDFNNMLTGMLCHTELALEQTDPESELREHLHRIHEGGRQCSDLTRQLMAYAGKGKPNYELIDLNEKLRESAALISSSVPKQVHVEWDLQTKLPLISADPTQMLQVMMNLILNAGEAIGDRPGTISVKTDEVYVRSSDYSLSTARVLPEGQYVHLSIQDTGSGMDSDTMAKIFDPFFTTKFAGRGLGLASVVGIIKAHGGTIDVESELGQGTTFTIYLPIATNVELARSQTPVMSSTDTHRPLDTPPPSVCTSMAMILSQDRKSIEVLARHFAKQSWAVQLIHSPEEAVEKFQTSPRSFDLVVIEADSSGLETVKRLRDICPEVRLILVLSEEDIPSDQWGLQPWVEVQKPLNSSKLSRAIRCAYSQTVSWESTSSNQMSGSTKASS